MIGKRVYNLPIISELEGLDMNEGKERMIRATVLRTTLMHALKDVGPDSEVVGSDECATVENVLQVTMLNLLASMDPELQDEYFAYIGGGNTERSSTVMEWLMTFKRDQIKDRVNPVRWAERHENANLKAVYENKPRSYENVLTLGGNNHSMLFHFFGAELAKVVNEADEEGIKWCGRFFGDEVGKYDRRTFFVLLQGMRKGVLDADSLKARHRAVKDITEYMSRKKPGVEVTMRDLVEKGLVERPVVDPGSGEEMYPSLIFDDRNNWMRTLVMAYENAVSSVVNVHASTEMIRQEWDDRVTPDMLIRIAQELGESVEGVGTKYSPRAKYLTTEQGRVDLTGLSGTPAFRLKKQLTELIDAIQEL